MNAALDLSDVPVVAPADLERLGRLVVAHGRGLVLYRGANADDRDVIEQAFWDDFTGETRQGVATLLRFWSLVDVFTAKRLRQRLLDEGHAILAKATIAAAQLRLNAQWGFNPQRVLWALDLLSEAPANTDFAYRSADGALLRRAGKDDRIPKDNPERQPDSSFIA